MSTTQTKVLIVDDSRLARMSVAKALKALRPDWAVVEAASADEAVAASKQTRMDMCVLDFNMPGRNGLVLAAELIALTPKMPLAILSANSQMEVIDGAHKLGARFLSKPLQLKDLEDFLGHAFPRG